MRTESITLRPEIVAIIARCLPMAGSRNPYRAYEFAKRQFREICETEEEYQSACRAYADKAGF